MGQTKKKDDHYHKFLYQPGLNLQIHLENDEKKKMFRYLISNKQLMNLVFGFEGYRYGSFEVYNVDLIYILNKLKRIRGR